MNSIEPADWYSATHKDPKYDYTTFMVPREISLAAAAERFSIQAQYLGWELTQVRKYTSGARRVLLRRKKGQTPTPDATLD